MSEGLKVLSYIHEQKGCLHSDLARIMGIPLDSLNGWIHMLCSTGYLTQSEEINHEKSPCSNGRHTCVSCKCSCHADKSGMLLKVEITKKGIAMIQRNNEREKLSMQYTFP
jgi:hypothetical protein